MQRITITIEDDLLAEIDAAAKARGYQNRSEIIRDLARAGLQQSAEDAAPSGQCVAALVYVYDHAARDLSKRLVQNFHGHHDLSLATLHVHLDDDSCMEVTALKGSSGEVRHFADHIIGVYQRYFSWYDGNPCNLNPLPPRTRGEEIRRVHGRRRGRDRPGRADFAKGEFRWVAQVMKEVVFAEPDNKEARALCADALEQMGYQAESATWRNAFLYGAQELRHGVFQIPARPMMSADTLAGLAPTCSSMRWRSASIRRRPRASRSSSTGASPTATRRWRSRSSTAR